MLNPLWAEIAVRDRIAELRRASAKRSPGERAYLDTDTSRSVAPRWSTRRARQAHPQRAIGWFLVSVGLRLALPKARGGSAR